MTTGREKPFVLEFAGPDASRFLNGQVTQDVLSLGDSVRPACVTDAKGRLQHFVELCRGPDPDSFWVVIPRQQSDGLRERLQRYLIADDVEVRDLGEKWTRIRCTAGSELAGACFQRAGESALGRSLDQWWAGDAPEARDALKSEALEDLRIARGLPEWGAELEAGMLPPEAGLDRDAISYTKGCYVGQEVLSRMKSAGKVNRRLALLTVPATARIGDGIFVGEARVGALTSVATAADGATPALGYLGKKAFAADVFPIISPSGEVRGEALKTRWA